MDCVTGYRGNGVSEKREMMLRTEEILRIEMSVSHWNGFFEWNDLK